MRPWAFPLVAAVLVASTVIVAGPVASGPASAQPPVVEVPAVNVVSWADDPWLAATDRLILVPLLGPLTTAGAVRFDELLGVAPTQIFTMGDGQSQVYSLGEEVSLDEARARGAALVAEGFAARAEPDYRVRRVSAPVNDPRWDDQWHLASVSATNYGIDVAGLWARTTGSASVVVAVLDSGITDHPDLNSRNIPVAGHSYPYGYDMISSASASSTSVDPRDGDGRDPDPTDEGDWQDAGECGQQSGSEHSSWHGTHVAGTIGAATNNGVGVAGVDQQARLIHVRVLAKCGGYMSDVADGIRWAAGLPVGDLPLNTHPARVINMSLGGIGACATVGQDAVTAAIAAGAILIAAAGNENVSASAFTPANCVGVITVAASTKGGARAAYSNYGARVDIAAPGGDESGSVLSTSNEGTTESASPDYAGLFGTSMAAPHVAGVVALMLSLSPAFTGPEIRTLLRATATPFPNPTDEDIGPGILNASALFVGPPTNVAATEGEPGSATVTWVAAPSPGGTLIGYLATPHLAGVAQPSLARSVGSAATAVTFDTLTNGTAYTFVVESLYDDNSRYASLPSNEVIPYDVPDAPTGVALQPSDGGVQVNWTAPNFNGGRAITGYEVAVTQVGAAITVTVTVSATSTSALVTGLTNGASYTATVGATNAAGTGAAGIAAATAQPLGVPGAATGVVAARGNQQLILTWTAPTLSARGGANIIGYIAQVSPGGGVCQTTGEASCIITGLTNGTAYTVTVAAVNSVGRGADSAVSDAVTPATLPSAPATVSAVTASSGQLLVSWDVTAGNGGATVTDYSATANPGGITCVVTGDSCVFERLTNGDAYTFTVVATNAVGDSVDSAASAGVAPVGLPSAPLRVVALPARGALTVIWEAPVDTGGSNVTSYTATASAPSRVTRTCSTAGLTCTITGLDNQHLYTVTVTATTAAGAGQPSVAVSATPLGLPSPQQFAATVAAATGNALNVANPVAGGSISVTIGGFTPNAWVVIGVSSVPTALGAAQANGSGTVSAQVTLPPNVGPGQHTLWVIDEFAPSTMVAQPVTVLASLVPGAPGQSTVAAGSGTGVVEVTFAAPGSDGGATITSYTVTAHPGAATCVRATAGTCAIVGLTPGTAHTFTVRATNSAGESPSSTPSTSFTPKARPGSAGGVTPAGNPTVTGRVSVTWTVAAANGANVTYVARAVQDPSKSCATAALTCNITGLPTYVALTFEVVASNSEGVGPVAGAATGVTLVPSLPASPREAPGVNAGSVASGTVASGSTASISVSGFHQFEWVAIVVQSTPQMLSTMQADAAGTVTTTVNVASGLSIGTHYLTVLSDVRTDGTRRGVTQSFSVADSATSNPGTGGGTGGGSTTFPAERFAGADRYSTSVEISRANFNPGVAVVYLATGANFADALAAGAAAGGAGPVLLVERTRVPTSTLTELGRLQPRHIVVLGGTAAIAESVVGAVRALATESIIRLGGADRFETAALVSAATFSPNVEVVYVATGANFADALAAGAAARGRGPVLLATRDGIPDATATELTRLRPRRIVVLGGTSAVAQSVQTALAGYTTGSVSRVGGADRYATAANLSRITYAAGVPVVYVATGTGFADALSAAALGAPVLLARPLCVPASTKAELDRLDPVRVVVLGGTAALSDDVRRLTVCR